MKWPRSAFFRAAFRTGLSDMRNRVGARVGNIAIEVQMRIRCPADTDGINHHKKRAGHQPIRSRIRAGTGVARGPILMA